MSTVMKLVAGGVAAAVFGAAPAAAQYYPGYPANPGYPPDPGDGDEDNQPYGDGYGDNGQALVGQCAAAVQQRLSGGYGNGYDRGYGGAYGGGRVLGISRVEPRQDGGFTVRGVATSGRYGGRFGYGGGYEGAEQPDLTWKCKIDYRGTIIGVDLNRAQPNSGYDEGYAPDDRYAPDNGYNDYSQYGYHRY